MNNLQYQDQVAQQQVQNQQPQNIQGVQKVECLLDTQSVKVISEAHPEFAEAIINLGIKMVAESSMYQTYMIKDEFKNNQSNQSIENTSTLDLSNTSPSNSPTVTNQTNSNTVQQPSAQTFAAW